MGIEIVLILVVIVAVIAIVGVSTVADWLNDTLGSIFGGIRDDDVTIPPVTRGQLECDIVATIGFKTTISAPSLIIGELVIEVHENEFEYDFINCEEASGFSNILSFGDFFDTEKEVVPLEFLLPIPSTFDEAFEVSYKIVDSKGFQRKLPHHQEISYLIPAFENAVEFEQKLVWRDLPPEGFNIQMDADGSRFFDKSNGQPFILSINEPQ